MYHLTTNVRNIKKYEKLTFQTRGKNMPHFQMHHAVQLSTKDQ